jgi:hypothetical protein
MKGDRPKYLTRALKRLLEESGSVETRETMAMRWTPEKVEELRSLAASGQSRGRIAKRFGVSSRAVHRYPGRQNIHAVWC